MQDLAKKSTIAKNPHLLSTWVSLSMGIFTLVAVIMLGWAFYGQPRSLVISQLVSLYIVGSGVTFGVIRTYLCLRDLQSIERRRFTILNRESVIASTIEPSYQPEIFLPSYTITITSNKTFVWDVMCFIAFLTFFLVFPPLVSIRIAAGILFFLLASVVIIGLILFFSSYAIWTFLRMQRTIEVTINGLQMEKKENETSYKTYINWNEARLFACYDLPTLFPGRKTTYYELYSSIQVITWMSINSSSSPFAIWKPLLPNDEHYQRIQALCDLVVTRTGLELHNLSQSLEEE